MLSVACLNWFNEHMTEISLERVVGSNVRRVRKARGWRQDDLAREARSIGLSWTRNVVANLESGRRNLTVGELLLLTTLLRVPVAQLLEADRTARIYVEEVLVPGDQLSAMATGEAAEREAFWDETERALGELTPEQRELAERYRLGDDAALYALHLLGDSEEKASRALAVVPRASAQEVAFASMALWGMSLGGKRDQSIPEGVEEDTLAAVRGHVTRDLLKHLEKRIEVARAG